MISNTLDAVREYLGHAGFEIGAAPTPFAFVAQSPSVIVFVAPVDGALQTAQDLVLGTLTAPFLSKKFGPKTMEMYCAFVSDRDLPLRAVERCEQDMKVCRKVVIIGAEKAEARLSFLCPLDDNMAAPLDAKTWFWGELEKRLTADELEFLRKVEDRSATSELVLSLVRKRL